MMRFLVALAILPALTFAKESVDPGIKYRDPENKVSIEFMSSTLDGDSFDDRTIGGVVNFDVNRVLSISTAYQRVRTEQHKSDLIQPQLNIGYTLAFDDGAQSQVKPYLIVGMMYLTDDTLNQSFSETGFSYGIGLRTVSYGFLSSSIEYTRSNLVFDKLNQLSFSIGVAF